MKLLSLYPLPGISYSHDASAAIVSDDGVLYLGEEERFLRGQHAFGHFPERSALMGLKQCHVLPETIDQLVITSVAHCRRQVDYRNRVHFAREHVGLSQQTPVSCVPHHLAHSALAALTSPRSECVFLTLDGGGDGRMGHWGTFRDGRFRILEQCDLSPAIFFSYVTVLCGFPLFEEGKVMGLAAYGDVSPRLLEWFREHFRIRRDAASLETDLELRWVNSVDLNRIDPDFFARHKYYRWTPDFIGHQDAGWIKEIPSADIARTGQVFFERLLGEIVVNVVRRTGLRNISCAGGAFQNVAAVGVIARQFGDVEFYVPCAPHDAGLSLGAALWTRHIFGRSRLPLPLNPFTGPDFSTAEVKQTLDQFGLAYAEPEQYEQRVAQLIANGFIVGWFDGRAEYGARALGARSILADPRSVATKDRLNRVLKKRDWFMPFAPSILEEHGHAYFEDFTPSPYMNVAFHVRPDKVETIQAVVHVDGTCRAQSVSRLQQPRYHAVLSHFNELTGVPMVLNTSFNRHGLPMVATPRQAVQHLLEACVDALAIGGLIVLGARPD